MDKKTNTCFSHVSVFQAVTANHYLFVFQPPPFFSTFIPPIRSASWQFAGLISKQKVLSGKSLRQQTLFGHCDRWGGRDALPQSGLLITELQRTRGNHGSRSVCAAAPLTNKCTRTRKSHKPAGGLMLFFFLRSENLLRVRVQTRRHTIVFLCYN